MFYSVGKKNNFLKFLINYFKTFHQYVLLDSFDAVIVCLAAFSADKTGFNCFPVAAFIKWNHGQLTKK